jgi:steroid delta-isomerase-like uncharacterized protein
MSSKFLRVSLTIQLLISASFVNAKNGFDRGETVKEKNKELIYIENDEIGNKGNLDIIPQLFAEGFAGHFLPDDSQTNGLAELRDQLDHHREAFPDWTEEIKLMIAEGDLVAIWFRSAGTNTGRFLGHPPTGNRITTNDISIFRIADGKIAEQWLLPDLFSLNSQLGLIPGIEAGEIGDYGTIQTDGNGIEMNTTAIQRNKELALKANKEIWNKGNIGNLEEMFAGDFVQHFLPFGTTTAGLEEFRKNAAAHRDAFPDWAEVVNLIVAEGEYVALEYTSTGTNTGSFAGNPATGKKIRINEVSIFRIVEGRIVEQWLLPDILSLNQQLRFVTPDK